jgi:hypothetical protein
MQMDIDSTVHQFIHQYRCQDENRIRLVVWYRYALKRKRGNSRELLRGRAKNKEFTRNSKAKPTLMAVSPVLY